jgi:hypothetical protein
MQIKDFSYKFCYYNIVEQGNASLHVTVIIGLFIYVTISPDNELFEVRHMISKILHPQWLA